MVLKPLWARFSAVRRSGSAAWGGAERGERCGVGGGAAASEPNLDYKRGRHVRFTTVLCFKAGELIRKTILNEKYAT